MRRSPAAARRPRAAVLAVALLAATAAFALGPRPAAAALAKEQAKQWTSYLDDALDSSIGSTKLSAGALNKVLTAHDFSTPLSSALGSVAYTGGNGRLRRVVSDLLAGKPVKIVAIGGLATNGTDASAPGKNDYFAIYVDYLSKAFPGATIQSLRSSVGLAPSAVVAGCIEKFLPPDADLVLLEMTANDGATMDSSIVNAFQPRGYESLVRKVLGGSRQPAVVLTQSMAPGMGNATKPFFMTPEAPQYSAVAGYYDVPVVSMRNALWPQGKDEAEGLMSTDAVLPADGSTPTDLGHAALADALVLLTQRTAQDLQLLPFGDWDMNALNADVPAKSMYGGVVDNEAWTLRNATCGWVRNATVSATGGCPATVGDMCGLDFSNWNAIRAGYAAAVPEIFGDDGSKGKGAIIGGVVGGVVGGLGAVGGLIGLAISRQKKRAAAEEAAWNAKAGGNAAGLPITASSGAQV
ncbi:hypothetical protein Rsub_04344 [Raphidocelis subcapitata]|uniref:SGNH hydrolase-type esterase domain-containing protein n=1 Tax=Raphidocelis subcapitata TaxID=307507 RepID=A0A2V0NVE0_9CHLO|nr:hypothetical protein Rsub_04344 [Raphidocelis subcapitata]|eukprot:GBF91604.1 hypothetical protein Rsub_04344 [Raphidocelis subcapitata]